MVKGKILLTLEKILKGYTLWTSLFMLAYVAYYLQYLLTNVDPFSWIIFTFPKAKNLVGQMMKFSLFYGIYNIIICGVIGIAMIFVRANRKLGLLAIFAAISFIGILYLIGDSF